MNRDCEKERNAKTILGNLIKLYKSIQAPQDNIEALEYTLKWLEQSQEISAKELMHDNVLEPVLIEVLFAIATCKNKETPVWIVEKVAQEAYWADITYWSIGDCSVFQCWRFGNECEIGLKPEDYGTTWVAYDYKKK